MSIHEPVLYKTMPGEVCKEATHSLEIVDTMKGSKPSWDGQRESQMALEILIAHWGKQPQEASTNQKSMVVYCGELRNPAPVARYIMVYPAKKSHEKKHMVCAVFQDEIPWNPTMGPSRISPSRMIKPIHSGSCILCIKPWIPTYPDHGISDVFSHICDIVPWFGTSSRCCQRTLAANVFRWVGLDHINIEMSKSS